MGIETKTGFIGIVTNTADLQAPPGALEKAKNVVIRRAGSCEPRPGLKPDATRSNTQRTIKIIPYELQTVLANNNSEWWNGLSNVSIALGIPQPAPPTLTTFRNDLIPHAQARGNLYVGTAKGVLKFDGATTGTSANPAFMLPWVPGFYNSIAAITTGASGWLPNSERANYRVVFVRTDANGLTSRSAPTGALTLNNSSGGSRNAQITVSLDYPNCTYLYDTVELYRTRNFPSSATIDEEYQIVGSMTVTSGTLVFADAMPNADRGATLYTSPSREGAEGSHGPVPAAGALAVFKGALFAGNLKKQAVQVVSFDAGDFTGIATGIGSRAYTGSTTNGSPNITTATSVGLERGMLVYQPGAGWGDISNLPYITNIAGAGPYTITLSANATATLGAASLTFLDGIEVNGSWEVAMPAGVIGTAAGTSVSVTSPALIQRVTPPVAGYDNTLLLTGMFADQSLTVRATHGGEYNPPLPVYGATALTVAPESDPNMLVWSNPDEPEHFALKSLALVGDKKRAILGLVATRDAMYIFKEDGIWRLTGTNGQYRIDPFDLTTRCILPSSIVPLKNRIFMLSNRGVVAVSDEGVEVVSMAIDDQLKKLIYTLDVAGAGSGYFLANVGYAGTACERDNEYMLLVGSTMLAERSNISNGALIYNDVTRAWTSWEFSNSGTMALTPYTWAFHDRYGVIKLAQRVLLTSYLYIAEPGATFTNSQTWRCDNTASLTVSGAVVGNVINYTPSNTLVAGDVLYNVTTGASAVVLSSFLGTQVTVDNATGFADTNVLTAIRPVACNVAPRAFTEQNLRIKQWVGINAEFTLLAGACSASFSALASVMTNTSTKVTTPFDIKRVYAETRYLTGASIRGVFPVQAARGYRMQAEVAWSHGWGDSTLESIFVETNDGKANAPNLGVSQ